MTTEELAQKLKDELGIVTSPEVIRGHEFYLWQVWEQHIGKGEFDRNPIESLEDIMREVESQLPERFKALREYLNQLKTEKEETK